jgi:hypothetical protein
MSLLVDDFPGTFPWSVSEAGWLSAKKSCASGGGYCAPVAWRLYFDVQAREFMVKFGYISKVSVIFH